MKNSSISMISGKSVPYNVSYLPSVIPQDDVVLQNYTPTLSHSLEALRTVPSSDSQFDRGTQTLFSYCSKPNKKRYHDSPSSDPSSMREAISVSRSLPLTRHLSEPADPINPVQIQISSPSKQCSPLTRSASYEKAILSSMRELDSDQSEGTNPSPISSHKTGSKKLKRSSELGLRSSSSLPFGFPTVTEVFHQRKGTFERWKKKTSFRKLSQTEKKDRDMKLLKNEHTDVSISPKDQKRNKYAISKCVSANYPMETMKIDDNEWINGGEVEIEADNRSTGNCSTLPLRTEALMRTKDEQMAKQKDHSTVVVINVKEKPSNKNGTLQKDESLVLKKNVSLENGQNQGSSPTRPEKQPRSVELLQKYYQSYPEGGGGGSEYPYLREMKERLLISKDTPLDTMEDPSRIDAENQLLEVHQTPVGTVVKLNADGYGSHTSPTHRVESFYTGTLESRKTNAHEFFPKNAKTSSFITLSLLYATLLVVVCLGFVLSEVLTHNVPLYYYEAFFTYLYGLSIFFLLYIFCYLLSDSTRDKKTTKNQKVRKPEVLPTDGSPTQEKLTTPAPKPKKQKTSDNDHSHGSFFLRIGAIAFGLGTMIYNGLEFGVFFEIPMDSPCYQILRGVNPLLQLIFTFMQMYFIFMNARLNIHKFKFIARFGLMHIVATNICVWVRTLVRESLKEINEFRVTQGHTGEDYMIMEGIRRALENRGLLAPNRYMYNLDAFPDFQEVTETSEVNETMSQGTPSSTATSWDTEEDLVNRTCERMEIMGSIVSDSAPYLYPFIVEYSLIGAAVVYIMWKHIGRNPKFVYDPEAADGLSVVSRRCHSKVDCIGASKGLFCGLLVLVATLICLILFFVLIHQKELRMLAIYLADVSHCGIMFLSIIAIFIGFCRVRHLKFFGEREEELDDILLMVSAFGLFAYAIFSAVAGSLSAFTEEPNLLVMVTGILSVIQVMIQMVFIKDTQRRQVALPEQERTKPGRQIVTFLLICNLAMWVIYTFETQKVEANPVQLEFFGKLSWTILLRCTLPLAIFHRFHSSVVLAAIWKNSYKTRLE